MSRFVNTERLWYHWMRHFNVMKIMLKPISTWLVFRSNVKTTNLHLRQWKIYSSWNHQTKMLNFEIENLCRPRKLLSRECIAQNFCPRPQWTEVLREQLRLFYLQQNQMTRWQESKSWLVGQVGTRGPTHLCTSLSNQGSQATANQVLEDLLRRSHQRGSFVRPSAIAFKLVSISRLWNW